MILWAQALKDQIEITEKVSRVMFLSEGFKTIGHDNSFEELINRRLASDSPQLNVPILRLPNTHAQRFSVSIVLEAKGAALESKGAV